VLIFDARTIGNKLLHFRKKAGLTQAEVAEKAGLSDRTYADIERGCASMRTQSLLRICSALNITPDEVLTENSPIEIKQEELFGKLSDCSAREKETALKLLAVYLESVEK